MIRPCPSLTVAGLGGDGGKTFVALALAAAWTGNGLRVAPFKKGPDYIDAAWLSLAAGAPCRNLDSFLMDEAAILRSRDTGCDGADIALIEGNRGLFDGVDVEGSHSTAALARLLDSPVLLVVDATKSTRTLAAIVHGLTSFDPGLSFAGVVLNRIGGSRHAEIARGAIERYTDVPVLGVIPRIRAGAELLPGRHLGLVTVAENPRAREAIERVRETVAGAVDLDRMRERAARTREGVTACILPHAPVDRPAHGCAAREDTVAGGRGVRIGVVRDSAFSFYYPENLEALERGGAELVTVDSLTDRALPGDLDALYIGGGFPETHVAKLADNRPFLASVRRAAEKGLPIYAECGGLMLLCAEVEFGGEVRELAGVFPYRAAWSDRPAGHGYVIGRAVADNPFYPVGTALRGHEFHHSRLVAPDGSQPVTTALELARGTGVGQGRDGLVRDNVLALYTHVHASGTVEWARGLLAAARVRSGARAASSERAGRVRTGC
ncbi:MAG: Cobyrinate a,c-diamide synthase [Calditrichaeota bacterium]|nr:Cobyrinate a,c-diamide synthase [Calditrichota bacterium]